MKRVYIIGGTMGVGKTAVCQKAKIRLPNSLFLDGDWCWDSHPFQVTDETKTMVMDNICYLLNNFIRCPAYDNIIFCWVLHEQSIINGLLSRIDTGGCEVKNISLVCSERALRKRLQKDVDSGVRSKDDIERSCQRAELYNRIDTIKIAVDDKSVDDIVDEIVALV